MAKNLFAFHAQGVDIFFNVFHRGHVDAAATSVVQEVTVSAVAADMGRNNTPVVLTRAQNYGSSPVAKKHAGITILPVDYRGQNFSADHQGVAIGLAA